MIKFNDILNEAIIWKNFKKYPIQKPPRGFAQKAKMGAMIHFSGPKSGAKGETWSKVYQDEWMAIWGAGVQGDTLSSKDLDKKLESHGRVQIKENFVDDFLDKDPVQKGDDANIQFYNAVENLKAGQLNKKNILNLARKYKIDKKEAIRFVKEMWATKLEATNPKLNKEAKRIKLSDLLNENVLGELPSSKLIKMKWNPLNEDMIYDMKKEYYDISDAMDILDSIKKLTPEDLEKLGVDKKMGWQGKEVKIWTQIQKLFRQSDLGRVL